MCSRPWGSSTPVLSRARRYPRPPRAAIATATSTNGLATAETFYDVTEYSDCLERGRGQYVLDSRRLAQSRKTDCHRRLAHGKITSRVALVGQDHASCARIWILHWNVAQMARSTTVDVPGYSSFMGYYPEKDISLVTLANLSNNKDGTSPRRAIARCRHQTPRLKRQVESASL